MRIIIVPSGTGKRHSTSLTRRKVTVLMISVFIVLPVLSAIAGYYLKSSRQLAGAPSQTPDYQYCARLIESGIQEQRTQVAKAKSEVENHLNALGRNLGRLQAQVSRINALGQRLTEMAGLDSGEFSFNEEPALGGPASSIAGHNQSRTDFIHALDRLDKRLQEKYEELNILRSLMMDRTLHKRQFPRGWPVEGGWLSSRYGYRTDPFSGRRDFHGGVDIAGKAGSSIKAVAAGIVTHAGIEVGYGQMVEINHGNGYTTRYAHALATVVEVGERVEKGQVVAIVGNSGRSTGPHLHFEVLLNDQTVNPRRYLKASRSRS
jgi:murein DD-endopeptidase MepM/ murein hydrolase activator NlpD